MTNHRVLIVGCDKGAWQMRGKQIGAALGATVTSKPKADHWAHADVVILVKHAAHRWANEARECRARLIWDVLDIWKQPGENQRRLEHLTREIRNTRDALEISTVIAATQAMADDIGGVYIPHHSHAGLQPTPIRAEARTVGYEGSERYLGSWRSALEDACSVLGLRFVVNPKNLADVDIVVALRDGRWNGAVCRQWKSGVKYVNAIAAGRPVVTQRNAAFFETRVPGHVIEGQDELVEALRISAAPYYRQGALDKCRALASAYTLEAVEQQYRRLIAQVARRAA